MTAMKELMEWMIDASEVIPVDPQYVYEKAEELLAKEKEQLKDAYVGGAIYAMTPEQYYNETYGK